MASRILITLRAGATLSTRTNSRIPNLPNSFPQRRDKRNFSIKSSSSLDPPDVHRLAETARISLTPQEVEEFGPKIQQVVEWFGQLRAVDLANVEPAIRSGALKSYPANFFYVIMLWNKLIYKPSERHYECTATALARNSTDVDGDNLRDDVPQTFENR
ncbi:hypothetical protein Cgig2_027919 [Carnegiea gigantea]|uniref:Uncharacterized protein n=1 Tax=Carnegiea gigantea TaxID=171969 RepID=A0A9Q1KLY4_9CARY|nr:hypothetical protein Cgig2_027919 [Carnegiea gigantea]